MNERGSESILAFASSRDRAGGPRVVPLTSHLIARRLDTIFVDISHSVEAVISENRFDLMVFHVLIYSTDRL